MGRRSFLCIRLGRSSRFLVDIGMGRLLGRRSTFCLGSSRGSISKGGGGEGGGMLDLVGLIVYIYIYIDDDDDNSPINGTNSLTEKNKYKNESVTYSTNDINPKPTNTTSPTNIIISASIVINVIRINWILYSERTDIKINSSQPSIMVIV